MVFRLFDPRVIFEILTSKSRDMSLWFFSPSSKPFIIKYRLARASRSSNVRKRSKYSPSVSGLLTLPVNAKKRRQSSSFFSVMLPSQEVCQSAMPSLYTLSKGLTGSILRTVTSVHNASQYNKIRSAFKRPDSSATRDWKYVAHGYYVDGRLVQPWPV